MGRYGWKRPHAQHGGNHSRDTMDRQIPWDDQCPKLGWRRIVHSLVARYYRKQTIRRQGTTCSLRNNHALQVNYDPVAVSFARWISNWGIGKSIPLSSNFCFNILLYSRPISHWLPATVLIRVLNKTSFGLKSMIP